MTGCEIIKCPDFKEGKCINELDYVSKIDGSPMCPRNDNAIARRQEEIIEDLKFLIHQLSDPGCLCNRCRKEFLNLYGIHWESGIGIVE